MKDLKRWTRKEFEALPLRGWSEQIDDVYAIVILPLRGMHDSGFRLMDFVACDKDMKPFVRLSGCSDVIRIDGIANLYTLGERSKWSIDCLPTSGLLRLLCRDKINVGSALSSFEITT